MESFIPERSVKFKKRALSFKRVEKKVHIKFEDGTSETADAVINCDGVKFFTAKGKAVAAYPASAPLRVAASAVGDALGSGSGYLGTLLS